MDPLWAVFQQECTSNEHTAALEPPLRVVFTHRLSPPKFNSWSLGKDSYCLSLCGSSLHAQPLETTLLRIKAL